MSRVDVSLRGDREIAKVIDSLSGRELQNRTRRATRAGAKVFRQGLRQRVTGSQYPKAYRKLATKNHRNGSTSTGPVSPLLNIFEGGAGIHAIGAPGQLLSNFATRREAGPAHAGGFFMARGPVSHPGVKAIPLIAPEFAADQDKASSAAMDKLTEGLR
ncbi:MAG: hypothetical protein V4515_12380 [Chloroflexota bacterium]